MARSVSVPSGALRVSYAALPDNEDDGYFEFGDLIDNFQSYAKELYPSLRVANRWIGREDRVVLENRLVSFVVSEYNGVVALSVVANEGYENLAENFATKLKMNDLVGSFGIVLYSSGRFSNGEQMFSAVSVPNKGSLGLGYSSKEGWL